jgi:hypothetical protein
MASKLSPSSQQEAWETLLTIINPDVSSIKKKAICTIPAADVDWKYLLKLAKFHGVAPLISHNLANNGLASQIPQFCLEQLNRIYYGTLYRNVIFSNELAKVLSVFSQNGISSIVLKGTILAEQLYGNPGLRTVTDLDILVKSEELSRVSSLLLEIGFKPLPAQKEWNHPFHETYFKQMNTPLILELHWNLDNQKLVTIPQQELWNRAQLLQIQGWTTKVLSPEDILLHLSNNLSKPGDQLLRSLCDITELLKKYCSILDWKYITESANSWGIGTSVYYSLRRSKELLGAPVPLSVINELKPKPLRHWLLDLLMNQEFLISAAEVTKIKVETRVIFRSLMMNHARQMLTVLSNFRNGGRGGMMAWQRTIFWTFLVFSAALWRYTSRFLSKGR